MTDTTELRTARPDVPAWLDTNVLTGTDGGDFAEEVVGLLEHIKSDQSGGAFLTEARYVAQRVNELAAHFEGQLKGVPDDVFRELAEWSGMNELHSIFERLALDFEAAINGNLDDEEA